MAQKWLIFVWILLAVGATGVGAAVWLLARSILRPPRMTDGKAVYLLRRLSPGDLGLEFEETKFTARDAGGATVNLAGWWIPAEASQRCIVLLHGYADAKVGAIAWAPLLHGLGWNVLAIDLRAHGESGGTICTAGVREREDVKQVIDQLHADRPGATREMALFGVSMGAAVALAVAAERADVAAVVAECPYRDFASAVVAQGELLGMAGPGLSRWAVAAASRMAGVDFGEVSPLNLLRRVTAPVMVIHSKGDALVSDSDAAAIAQVLAERDNTRDVLWNVEGAHLMAMQTDLAEYRRRVGAFLDGAVGET